ncbi:phage tail assembly chaperone [Sphingomonas azotifigens]|uniref:phage tail assembly chaperone n=1 Tax=Sphingomonas azotifigens TaxID=330920 RepID=UPI001FE8F547|nr:hypothetical protein [Sphingomonas azotifigens]
MAWLNTVPKPDERTRRARANAPVPTLTRAEKMKLDRIAVPMPPNPLPHIVERLLEIGLSEAAAMGVGPVSWLTIDAWCRLRGIDLPAWEALLIRQLSVEYVAEQRRAESENCPPPWRWQVTEAEKKAELAALEMVLG